MNVPTATVWLLGRIVLSGQDDLPNVKTIQQGMKLMPLSAFVKGGSFVPHRGSYSAADEFVPVGKVLSMSPTEFFSTANALMKVNPPAAADAPLMKKLSAIGVGPGLTFSAALLGENPSARWKAMQKELRPQLTEASGRFSRRLGGWVYYGRPIGDFGTEYPYRAIIALAGRQYRGRGHLPEARHGRERSAADRGKNIYPAFFVLSSRAERGILVRDRLRQ